MRRDSLDDFLTFIAVARERSFTKAAAKLGVSQSALSYSIRTLEERLGVRLLTRTTRSVSLTEAGDRLFRSIAPNFDEIASEIAALSALREKPAGTVRITTVEHAGETIIWPAMVGLMRDYPDIRVEIIHDYGLADIAADRFDAGVRLGEQVDKDMISARIGPDFRMAVVAAPSYFVSRSRPVAPEDLADHACIALRLPTGGLAPWEFRQEGRELKVRVQGHAAFNTLAMIRQASLEGFGLAYLPEDLVTSPLEEGRLVRVLEDWCPLRPGYHLYYPSRRQPSPAFALVLETLRYRD
ncbi:LysR family transcriptional regulator [Mesorhizobium sp. M7A.F.Ca.US.011.01.1.1]|uniref:LysR family transcriptional regulator n=1 Tax=Mesorhizobium sp. M7A.F.Ca.US.011.01.1.1 TaxID=2496741 RepID=UPI000FCB7841|nr:LysR family transcriptional regulator [Mesorhizobium sp. M7A.F.Ca.US.011.01.1.1]RUX31651.1 LysR family transcriptional regulator [Mesorhizobium sp. M7A.F.Ca.US.011.01.1.1]